jgi:hypothetical protein
LHINSNNLAHATAEYEARGEVKQRVTARDPLLTYLRLLIEAHNSPAKDASEYDQTLLWAMLFAPLALAALFINADFPFH